VSENAPQIAVIEDDDSFRLALVELLGSLGLGATGFASAEAFLAADPKSNDCVISDIHLPGMSGLELGRHLISGDPALPIIIITAILEQDLDAKAAAASAVCLLIKPFGMDALIECLRKALVGWSPASI
jgi:FixJ family two-component response regulator